MEEMPSVGYTVCSRVTVEEQCLRIGGSFSGHMWRRCLLWDILYVPESQSKSSVCVLVAVSLDICGDAFCGIYCMFQSHSRRAMFAYWWQFLWTYVEEMSSVGYTVCSRHAPSAAVI